MSYNWISLFMYFLDVILFSNFFIFIKYYYTTRLNPNAVIHDTGFGLIFCPGGRDKMLFTAPLGTIDRDGLTETFPKKFVIFFLGGSGFSFLLVRSVPAFGPSLR